MRDSVCPTVPVAPSPRRRCWSSPRPQRVVVEAVGRGRSRKSEFVTLPLLQVEASPEKKDYYNSKTLLSLSNSPHTQFSGDAAGLQSIKEAMVLAIQGLMVLWNSEAHFASVGDGPKKGAFQKQCLRDCKAQTEELNEGNYYIAI